MYTHKQWFLENLESIQDSFEFRLESHLFEIGEAIARFMKEQNLNRAQMAERLGVSRARVTNILNGNPNLTVKTLLKMSDVLGKELEINFKTKLTYHDQQSATFPSIYLYSGEDIAEQEKNPSHYAYQYEIKGNPTISGNTTNDSSLAA
ncbi:MAG: helix-turn-helix transcriptional regulator [Nitrospirales bacterium]